MRCKLAVLILMSLIPVQTSALSFKQVAYIPSGIIEGRGYIKGLDINHDGYQDLVFTTQIVRGDSFRIVYWGYRPFNRYVFEDSSRQLSLFWDLGNLDSDSLIDVVAQGDTYPSSIRVFEPSNYWSFPKIRVWNWPYEWVGNNVQPMYITDLDQDGLKEILNADAQVIYVFENRGNNQYQKVFSDTVRSGSVNVVPTGSFATGDLDGDGRMEFAVPTYGSNPSDTSVFVYKCTGNDQYQRIWGEHLNTANMYDCNPLLDMDGDGKPEFMIGSLRTGSPSPWQACLWIYKSTGPNQYGLIYADSIPVTDRGVYAVHSDCGDIDRDGKPELVWAIDRDWMVYKYDSLSHQFQRVFTAYGDNGHVNTNIHIHDMNGNGYPEIIESGGGDLQGHAFGETHIWEVETCRLVYPNGGETLYGDSLAVIRWRNVDPFQADSFSLFYSSDSGLTYSPVAHGIPGADSAYAWTIPETYSDDCFVMLWAYQNATGWDFSDSHFRIRDGSGVEVSTPYLLNPTPLPLSVSPNPFLSFTRTPGHEAESFVLYDVSGRKVGVYKGDRIGADLSPGVYFLSPEGNNTRPKKVVKVR
jgi:hypothetical protein